MVGIKKGGGGRCTCTVEMGWVDRVHRKLRGNGRVMGSGGGTDGSV